MGGSDSSSSSSEEDKKKKKSKSDKKAKKKEAAKGKGKKSKKDVKVKKKDKKKRKAASSSSSSAAPADDDQDEMQEKWISAREKAIRKAEPGVSKAAALERAVAEYVRIFEAEVKQVELPSVHGVRAPGDRPLEDDVPEDGPVAEAAAEAERQAREDGKAAGKSAKDIEEDVRKAREAVVKVARASGLMEEAELETMFGQQIAYEKAEAKRLAAWMPRTDDGSTQLMRNEANRRLKG
eukprot:TRINITY_DN4032_c0_g1_i1.p1 TRINITY_DN4032_c0_g1~~TRINITY_DN4032_c0_g1_i1.p1  ORF type:complete len:276 (+),score=97.97 TRINITY_DN4032_c0_g1_i1:118-828(+)